jgi:membrane fusion protein (multidrug efflux system)
LKAYFASLLIFVGARLSKTSSQHRQNNLEGKRTLLSHDWIEKMYRLRTKNQVDEQPALFSGVKAPERASPERVVAPLPSPLRSLLVPGSAILIALAGVVVAGTNWNTWIANHTIQSTDDASIHSDISAISARVGGTVDAVGVHDYARVKAGDLLFSIDRAPYDLALRSSKAKLEAARAQLQNNASQRVYQLAQIEVAVAQQQSAVAGEVETKKELERQMKLAADGRASTVQVLERATGSYGRARANLKMTDATVAAQRAQLDVLAKQQDALRASVEFAAAEVAANELDLSYTQVRASIDGVVAKRNVQIGMYVGVGTNLISIVPLPQVYILANYKENQLARVRKGQPVAISVDMLPWPELPRDRIRYLASERICFCASSPR